MNWANVVSKNIPKETAPPVSAASQPTKNVQKTSSSSSSNAAAASSGVKTYDSDFPEFNNTSGPKPATQQKVEGAVAVAAATAALTINDDTEGFQATNKPKRRSNEGENQQQRENKPFNRERRNNNDNNRRSHDNNRERKQSGSDRQHDNHRDNRKSEGGNSGYRDRRPPRHQNADADNQQGADARPKVDFKARKLEEEQQLKERFKDPKANLGFTEAIGDLFSVSDNVSLAHCVSADLEMGKGIAVEFKKRFGRVDELLSHYPRPGKCSFLNDKQRYVFYLVTKKVYSHKPTYKALEDSLKSMRVLCDKFKVTDIAMPRIGCGLDQLDWNLVSRIIDDVFTGSNINITIYSLSDSNNN